MAHSLYRCVTYLCLLLSTSALSGCAGISLSNSQAVTTLSSNKTTIEKTIPQVASNEARLEGIPLSCRIGYLRSFNIEAIKTENDPYSVIRNRYARESDRIIDFYIETKRYDEGLKFVQIGSLGWIDFLEKYASQGESKKAVQIVQTARSQLSPEKKQEILAEIYLAAEDSKRALEQLQTMHGFDKARFSIKTAVLLAKEQQFAESNKLLSEGMLLPKNLPQSYNIPLLLLAIRSFIEADQNQKAVELIDKLRSINGFSNPGQQETAVGEALINVANSYLKQKKLEQALAVLAEVEQRNKKLLQQQQEMNTLLPYGPSTPSHIIFGSVLAEDTVLAYATVGRIQKAIELTDFYAAKYKPWHVDKRLKIAQIAWRAGSKTEAEAVLSQARKIIESNQMKLPGLTKLPDISKLYILLDLSETEQEFGQKTQAKRSVDTAAILAKALPSSNLEETSNKTKAFNQIFRNYTALGEYDQALALAQAETDPQERDRLVKLIQCATQ